MKREPKTVMVTADRDDIEEIFFYCDGTMHISFTDGTMTTYIYGRRGF